MPGEHRMEIRVEAAFLDDPPGPDAPHQLVLAEDIAMGLDERHQHVERPPTELDRLAIGEQFAAMRQDLKAAELDRGNRSHRGRL